MRLIDADKVPEAFNYEDGSWWFQGRIDEFPTIDAQPVVHAKWIGEVVFDCGGIGSACQECSNCHKVRTVDEYCSNCGAKMDGE